MLPEKAVKEKQKKKNDNQLQRSKISQNSRDELKTAISNVDDPDSKQALETMYEIMTGETIN